MKHPTSERMKERQKYGAELSMKKISIKKWKILSECVLSINVIK